ncbi:MAG: hypothetical protein ACJAU8_000030 [Candidatus Paceibacteria bacterium]|jgi:hypothetical protein
MSIVSWVINFILQSAFVWMPILLGIVFFHSYMAYMRKSFKQNSLEYVMLEINIPKDVFKSPQAMEWVIDVLWHLGGGVMDWKNRFWDGAIFYPSSLEIVSIEGNIYFFIRTSTKIAGVVKSTIYSQYPNAEVNEVDDYTRYVPDYNKNGDTWSLYGAKYKLAKDDFLPIKTYVDYGLDVAVGKLEEEEKIDPITPLLEYLGTIRTGEQIWIQIVLQADVFSPWRKEAQAKIDEVMMRGEAPEDDSQFQQGAKLSFGEQEQIKAIERSLSKHAFECVIRGLYIAKKENENKSIKGYFKGHIFKPFNSMYLNGIQKHDDTTSDWVWEDLTGLRYPAVRRRFFNDYINRAGLTEGLGKYLDFGLWHKRTKKMVLTSEELATLFHIPGRVSETVAVDRIDAKKSEAPANLPL